MSVNYESALIYGYNCDRSQWSREDIEQMDELGWDIVEDYYDADGFLYIGKVISHTNCFEEARVDCLAGLEQAKIDIKHIFADTPWELVNKLPQERSMYHLCYAT